MQLLIECDRVCRRFGERIAIDSLSLGVQRGEVLGLVGRNGAGKTTVMRMILGLIGPSSGVVRVFGVDPRFRGVQDGRRIAALLEVNGLYRDLTLRDNLRFWARLYCIEGIDGAVDRALEFAQLRDRQGDRVGDLSKGMAQKLALARAAMVSPEIIVLDEPTSGIDPVFQGDVRERVLALNERGVTIVLSSHNLTEVEELCSQVVILDEGHVMANGPIDDVRSLVAGRTFDLWFAGDHTKSVGDLLPVLSELGACRRGRERNMVRLILENGHDCAMVEMHLRKTGFGGVRVKAAESSLADVFEALVGRESRE